MYYSGTSPEGRPIFVARSDAARLRQHGILMGTARSEQRRTPYAAGPRTQHGRR